MTAAIDSELATPAATSRGLGEAAFREVGELILKVLDALRAGQEPGLSVRERVRRLTETWPIEGAAHG